METASRLHQPSHVGRLSLCFGFDNGRQLLIFGVKVVPVPSTRINYCMEAAGCARNTNTAFTWSSFNRAFIVLPAQYPHSGRMNESVKSEHRTCLVCILFPAVVGLLRLLTRNHSRRRAPLEQSGKLMLFLPAGPGYER